PVRPRVTREIPVMARPHIVIVGAGFGGLSAAHALARAPADVTVIDRRNYHLFQPLLYQVATAGLSPAQIAAPIRAILRRAANVQVLLGRVTGVDKAARMVTLEDRTLSYDWLVLATGARHAYFVHDDWEAVAPGLKKIDEATEIRRRLLIAFERAEVTDDPEERRRLLTFAVIGGGPTGVEMAGAIAELANKSLAMDYRRIEPAQSRVHLIEAGSRILPSFPEHLSQAAKRQLTKLGVDVVTGDAVVRCSEGGVTLKTGRHIDAATIIWGAGVMASPAAKWLKAEADGAGRIIVGPDLR